MTKSQGSKRLLHVDVCVLHMNVAPLSRIACRLPIRVESALGGHTLSSALMAQFLCRAQATPDIVFLDGERQVTYGAAAADVTARARCLTDAADGRPVLLKGSNSAAWVLSFLAARAAGLVVVPLSEIGRAHV